MVELVLGSSLPFIRAQITTFVPFAFCVASN
jgi:hypothetical protein